MTEPQAVALTLRIEGAPRASTNIRVVDGRVLVDGVEVVSSVISIQLEIVGNVNYLQADECRDIKISGHVNGDISLGSGSVCCSDVYGSVTTMSGSVDCGSIKGNVQTTTGSVTTTRVVPC